MVKASTFLWFNQKTLILLTLLFVQNVTSFWEYAVCTKSNIIFFDGNWQQLEPEIKRDGHLKAITYDPVRDILYFTDRLDSKTSIFSLKVNNDTTFAVERLVERTEGEKILDLVYDFHDDVLYWSDSGNNKIVKLIFDRSKNLSWRNETFLKVKGEISGLEIDSCQRNLYYTITYGNPSINVISLDKKDDEPISFGNENHYKPTAIAMDHQQRRLYVGDVRKYNSYSIDSLDASGSDFRTEIDNSYKTPRSVAVDSQFVYYVEGSDHELRRFNKFAEKKQSMKFKEFSDDPNDLIVRSNFMIDLDPKLCKVSEKKIEIAKKERKEIAERQAVAKTCLHGGSLDKTTSNCMCMENFDGDFCEINLCYNFCLNGGDCSMNRNEKTQRLEPKCSCKKGFTGDHCEVDVCFNFCFNNGRCDVDVSRKPTCSCDVKFSGTRCETLKQETIIVMNSDVKKEVELTTTSEKPTTKVPVSIAFPHEVSDSLVKTTEDTIKPELLTCPRNPINLTVVILAVCFTISLLIFLVILTVIKKFNRPMRPKIRKKYVVHKNIEPLTYRPTTEQCEVIIEDCCNMNICETPCFDPKVLQQEINEGNISVKLTTSKKCSSKDDKQDLLKNMEYNE